MARGVNKVILLGRLGQDPEVRTNQAGVMFASLNLATDESYKDKQTGQVVPRTEWHRVIFSARMAEIAQQYLRKGSQIYVEGRLATRKYTDQGGIERYVTEIRGSELQMLGDKPAGQQSTQNAAPQQPAQQQRQAAQRPAQQQQQQMQPDYGLDDDIPF